MNIRQLERFRKERWKDTRASKDVLALALVAALVLLFFWRIITPKPADRAVFPPGDFTDQFWAFRMVEARAFAAGRLPLWAEDYNSGHPFLADVQSAVFYPVGLLTTLGVVAVRGADFTLFDLELEAILHYILTGAFTYLLARRLIGSRAAALGAALTFTFGGYLTSYPPLQLAILETATWLPLVLLLLDLAVEKGTRYHIAAGVVLGIAALAGHPQTFLFVVYTALIYYAWRVVTARNVTLRFAQGKFVGIVLTLVIAGGIAAAQWVPTMEYQSVSTRAAISWQDAASGFPTIDPLQMILPGFVAAFQSPLYIGILPLWLALFALFMNGSRERVFWALLAVGALLVAFGFYVFAYAVLYLFAPGFAMFRDQERLAFIVSFALAILAGMGLKEVLQETFDRARARRVWALLPAGLTIAVMLLLVFYSAATVRSSGRLSFLLDRSGLIVLTFILTSVLVHAKLSGRIGARTFAGLAVLLIVFDLFSVNNAAFNAAPTPRYPVTPVIAEIQKQEKQGASERVADEGQLPGHFGIGYQLQEVGGISPLRVARYDALLDLPPEIVFPLLNVRYLISGRPGFANSDVVLTDGDTRLIRLNNTLPRAWMVYDVRQIADDGDALQAMQSDTFNPTTTAFVADEMPFSAVPNAALVPVEFKPSDPEHVSIAVNTPTDGLLVMSEVYYPGWSATVDGAATPIMRADVALRGIPLHAGKHQIEMVYDPWSVKVGIGVTVGTLALLVLGLLSANSPPSVAGANLANKNR